MGSLDKPVALVFRGENHRFSVGFLFGRPSSVARRICSTTHLTPLGAQTNGGEKWGKAGVVASEGLWFVFCMFFYRFSMFFSCFFLKGSERCLNLSFF